MSYSINTTLLTISALLYTLHSPLEKRRTVAALFAIYSNSAQKKTNFSY